MEASTRSDFRGRGVKLSLDCARHAAGSLSRRRALSNPLAHDTTQANMHARQPPAPARMLDALAPYAQGGIAAARDHKFALAVERAALHGVTVPLHGLQQGHLALRRIEGEHAHLAVVAASR